MKRVQQSKPFRHITLEKASCGGNAAELALRRDAGFLDDKNRVIEKNQF